MLRGGGDSVVLVLYCALPVGACTNTHTHTHDHSPNSKNPGTLFFLLLFCSKVYDFYLRPVQKIVMQLTVSPTLVCNRNEREKKWSRKVDLD